MFSVTDGKDLSTIYSLWASSEHQWSFFTAQKAAHRLFSSAAGFYSGFIVLLYYCPGLWLIHHWVIAANMCTVYTLSSGTITPAVQQPAAWILSTKIKWMPSVELQVSTIQHRPEKHPASPSAPTLAVRDWLRLQQPAAFPFWFIQSPAAACWNVLLCRKHMTRACIK